MNFQQEMAHQHNAGLPGRQYICLSSTVLAGTNGCRSSLMGSLRTRLSRTVTVWYHDSYLNTPYSALMLIAAVTVCVITSHHGVGIVSQARLFFLFGGVAGSAEGKKSLVSLGHISLQRGMQ